MWQRFPTNTRIVLRTLTETAERERGAGTRLTTTDLLRAMLQTPKCVAVQLLDAEGVRFDDEILESEAELAAAPVEIGDRFSAALRCAVEGAYTEAVALGDRYIGTEHFLLALLRDSDGASGARALLRSKGADAARIARRLLRTQGHRTIAPREIAGELRLLRAARRARNAVLNAYKRARQILYLLANPKQPFMPFLLHRNRTLDDPFSFYGRLRTQPVAFDALLGSYVVSGYDEAVSALANPAMSAERVGAATWDGVLPPAGAGHTFNTLNGGLVLQMLFTDPPRQRELRQRVGKAFTPRVIATMREQVVKTAAELLDAVESRGSMDVIRDYAFPLPATVIARLLGVPSDDIVQFKEWSDEVIRYISQDGSLAQDLAARQGIVGLDRYFRKVVARLRETPDDSLLSTLIAENPTDGTGLTDDEIIANCGLLLTAGHETTTHLIGNGLLALFRNPEQLTRLTADWESLGDKAIDELLRYDSPVQFTARIAKEEFTLGGVTIPVGKRVVIGLSAANRDARRFTDPERLDVERDEARHIAFGYGPHYCLGAALARMEARVALEMLLTRFPNLRPVQLNRLAWRRNLTFRALKSFPVVWH